MNWFRHRKIRPLFIVASAAGMVLVGVLIGLYGLTGVILIGALLVGVAIFLFPEAAFIASILSIILGQLLRIQLPNSDNTVIINDLLLPAVIVAWLLKRLASKHWPIPRSSLTLPMLLWAGIAVISLVVNRSGYSQSEILSGALYLVRWIEYAAVLIIGYDAVRTRQRAMRYVVLCVWTGVLLSILGFIQLKVFPDFSFMVPKGWDPHVGRLLSTWFDPNYLAGYLAFLTSIALAIALSRPWRQAGWWWTAVGIMTAAVILTFSRSGYLAFAAGVGMVALFRSRTILVLGFLSLITVVLFVPRVQERVIGIRTIDETAQLRLVSWQDAWTVYQDHPIIGVGYNLYKYVQVQYNFLAKTSEHSASGSDSSLLTVGVTTGAVGLLAYLWLLGAMIREAWRTWRDRSLPREWQGFGLGLGAGLVALIIHGQFVNGLLYPHLMQVMWLGVAIAIMVRQPSTTSETSS